MSDRKKFKKWMKRQGAWHEYKQLYGLEYDSKLGVFLDKSVSRYYILNAFSWMDSGDYMYWEMMNQRWAEYIDLQSNN